MGNSWLRYPALVIGDRVGVGTSSSIKDVSVVIYSLNYTDLSEDFLLSGKSSRR